MGLGGRMREGFGSGGGIWMGGCWGMMGCGDWWMMTSCDRLIGTEQKTEF